MKLNLPTPPLLKTTLGSIPPGEPGVRVTLAHMLRLVYDSRTSPTVRDLVAQLIARVPQHDVKAEATALFNFVRDRIRYTRDPLLYEMLQSPEQLLARRQGDCDDKSILLMSLLTQIGIPSGFVVGGRRPNAYEHVWVEALIDGSGVVSMDATENRQIGWRPPLPYTMRASFDNPP